MVGPSEKAFCSKTRDAALSAGVKFGLSDIDGIRRHGDSGQREARHKTWFRTAAAR
ncbi:hypothetical protein [Paludisphaera borealis]|uniref:hypothetical protein n=1 Tax=Paludisphaera borealis TaxID=1387353 RepID=UPI00143D7927|nr:hypothetical protein [Paludisphaera borealis]